MEMLELIELNKALPNVTSAEKVALNPTPPQKWAVRLMRTVEAARQLRFAQTKNTRVHDTRTSGEGHQAVSTIAFDENILMPSNEVFKLAESMGDLATFSAESVKAWWLIAYEIFLEVTKQEPWNVPELKSYANSSKVDLRAKDKKFDGVMRDGVVKAVKKAFFDLAS